MVRAGTAHGNRPDDHQLVEVFGVREFSDRGCLDIAAVEDLIEIHLGHAAGGVLRVVVAGGVDHQAVEHALHLAFNLVEQRCKLAGFDEAGDVVVGVETLLCEGQALADLHRNRRSLVSRIRHSRGRFHKHVRW